MKGRKFMLFRDFIKGQCGLRGITLKKMCDDCNINYANFATTYRKRKTPSEALESIAKYFGVTADYLESMEVK